MSSANTTAATFLTLTIGLFLWSIATRQGERLFDRKGPNSLAWRWLRTFRIATTRENCARLTVATSVGGVIICLACLILVLWREM